MSLLTDTVAAVGGPHGPSAAEARARLDGMTKPQGSLGVLEDVGVQLCALAASCPPPLPEPAVVVVFAADHGVHVRGVSQWPQEVTAQMVANICGGGAVVNVLAAQVRAEVRVVDVGVATALGPAPQLTVRKVRAGTADMTAGPAMSPEEAEAAVEVGIAVADELVDAGARCLVTGDMGIANTTASSALIAGLTGAPVEAAVGRGAGADDRALARKVAAVRAAIDLHRPHPADPMGTLAAVGGLEQAALAGLLLAGAARRVPVVLDGLAAGAAALVAAALAPAAFAWVAGHRSAEPGHGLALEALGLRPLLDLDMRLGEGSGALLALPLVQSAARVLRQVATFDGAGVSGKSH